MCHAHFSSRGNSFLYSSETLKRPLKGQCTGIVYACLYVIYRPVLLCKCMKLMSTCAITIEERWKDCAKRGLRNRVALLSVVLNSEKLILVCGRAVISRSERNVGAHIDNRPPTVMHSGVDIHRYSVANIITKTSMTEAISLTVTLYRLSLLLHVYYRITYSLF